MRVHSRMADRCGIASDSSGLRAAAHRVEAEHMSPGLDQPRGAKALGASDLVFRAAAGIADGDDSGRETVEALARRIRIGAPVGAVGPETDPAAKAGHAGPAAKIRVYLVERHGNALEPDHLWRVLRVRPRGERRRKQC